MLGNIRVEPISYLLGVFWRRVSARSIRDMLPAKNSLLALDARLHFAGFFYLETIQFLRKRGYGL